MKRFLVIVAMFATLFSHGQSPINVPVAVGDTVKITKNNVTQQAIPANNVLDSAFRFTFSRFFLTPIVAHIDTLKVISASLKSGTVATLTHTVIAPAGSIIVVSNAAEGSGRNSTITGNTLTWTKRADAQAASSGDAEIYTAPVSVSGTYTVTAGWGITTFNTSVAYVVTGAEGVGAIVTANTQAAPLVNITTTKANSLLIGVSSDYNARSGTSRQYRDGAIERLYQKAAGGTGYHYSKQATSVKQYTEGITNPSNMSAGTCFIEIVATSTGVLDTEAPSAPTLSVLSTSTTAVNLSWTAATDNVNVVLYDVYQDGILKASTSSLTASISGLSPSTAYVFLVDAKDGAGNITHSNSVTGTTAAAANQSPVARAGNDISITLPVNSVTLSGTGSTDADGNIVTYAWTKISGPGTPTISAASSASTGVSGLLEGTYVYRLTVTDDGTATGTDDISIVVAPAVATDTSTIRPEGFGANATGGSGTTYHVTNTNASGAGSLAVGIGSNKTIVFDVSGTIVGRFDLISISFLTIDATVGNRDITIDNQNNGDGISCDGPNTHHIILRGLRVINSGGDGINVVDGAHDILIDRCSAYGNRDGNIDIAGDNSGQTKNVTVQWCFIGGGATSNSSYSGSTLVTGQNVTLHHNFYFPAATGDVGERCPLVHCNYSPVGAPNADFRNNLVWKWGRSNGTGSGYGTDIAYSATANVINNYYYSSASASDAVITNGSYGSTPSGLAYVNGNVSGNGGVNPNSANNHAIYTVPTVATQDACTAARRVLTKVGPATRSSYETNALADAANLPGCPAQ
jgi:chitodextrinase